VRRPSGHGKVRQESDIACPNCGRMLVEKVRRWASFWAAPATPNASTSTARRPRRRGRGRRVGRHPLTSNIPCPNCGQLCWWKKRAASASSGVPGYPNASTSTRPGQNDRHRLPRLQAGRDREKRSKKGVFYGCNRYPECKMTLPASPSAGTARLRQPADRKGLRDKITGVRCSTRSAATAKRRRQRRAAEEPQASPPDSV
jgi:ssDNA-binding Zn-finger/Zn-ribbon topoisomerase 1